MFRLFRKKKPAESTIPAGEEALHDDRSGSIGNLPDAPDSDDAADPSQHEIAPLAAPPIETTASAIDARDIDLSPIAPPATEHPAAPASPAPRAAIAHAPATKGKPSWRERLSNSALGVGLRALFSGHKALDEDLLDELETTLLTADVGVAATNELINALRRDVKARRYAHAGELLADLRTRLRAMVEPVAQPLRIDTSRQPFVILVVGVNGVGKTTTIGKLARRYRDEGLNVALAAGDTFRAAAVAQLQTWGDRVGIPVYSQGQGADSASVIFDALQSSRSRATQLLIADTAGRLHTQSGLMDELAKVRRVMAKLDADAPHEVLQVIDGTTGQNAINQVRQFDQAAGVTGLVVTKLDGSAKGGVIFALAREFGRPIRYVGLGEGAEDLQPFDPDAFIDGLLPDSLGH